MQGTDAPIWSLLWLQESGHRKYPVRRGLLTGPVLNTQELLLLQSRWGFGPALA